MQQAEDLKAKGVQELACISVNDAFVMAAWGKEHGADGKVKVALYFAIARHFCDTEPDCEKRF